MSIITKTSGITNGPSFPGTAGVSPAPSVRPAAGPSFPGTAGVSPAPSVRPAAGQSFPGTAGVSPAPSVRPAAGQSFPGTAGVSPAPSVRPARVCHVHHNQDLYGPGIMSDKWHSRGYLPHFDGDQLVQFVTFRLHDSVPSEVIDQWKKQLDGPVSKPEEVKFAASLRKRIEQYEDIGRGNCYLKEPVIAGIVQNALLFYDVDKYKLIEWCIMPNHVHVVIGVNKNNSLSKIVHGWKSFTAHAVNNQLSISGPFWKKEYFDRYIRNEKHYNSTVEYIYQNPVKAGLVVKAEDWKWSSAFLRTEPGRFLDAGETPAVPGKDLSPRRTEPGRFLDAGETPAAPGKDLSPRRTEPGRFLDAGETPAAPGKENARRTEPGKGSVSRKIQRKMQKEKSDGS